MENWNVWIRRVVLVMTTSMALYFALSVWSGLEQLSQALTDFPLFSLLPTVLGLVLFGWFLRALRWHYFVRILKWPVGFFPSLIAFFASFAFTATPGKAGEVVKSGLLRTRYGVSIANSVAVLLVERLGDLIAVLILAVGGLTLLADAWVYFLICASLVGTLTLFVSNEKIYRVVFLSLGRFARFEKLSNKMLELFGTSRSLLRPVPFTVGIVIAVIAWSCEALAFYLIITSFGFTIGVFSAFSVYGLSTVIGALSMLPGGVGGVEASMLLLLSALGIGAGQAVAPIVMIRFCTLWFISLLGFLFLGVWWVLIDRPSTAGDPEAREA